MEQKDTKKEVEKTIQELIDIMLHVETIHNELSKDQLVNNISLFRNQLELIEKLIRDLKK